MKLILTTLLCFALSAPGQTRSKMNSTTNRSGALTGWATFYTVKSCQPIWDNEQPLTASGKFYDESAFTCALPFHPKKWRQKYRITNLKTGQSTIVTHEDYGPGRSARGRGVIIDLTPAAFEALGGRLADGRIKVRVEKQ